MVRSSSGCNVSAAWGTWEGWLAIVLAGLVVGVPVGLVGAGYTPLPLGERQGMLPWALEGVGATDGRGWDALWWDGVAQVLSWRWILGDALRRGEIPYWSPWSFCGQPFVANGQSACLYPPAMVLCWLLPAAKAVGWLWVLHVALALGLTAWLGRRLGMSWLGAVGAGAIYATGGFMLAWAPVQSLMMSAAWLPGALAGVEVALHDRRAQGAALVGACLAMAVLAGHMQVAGYVWLATAAWAAGRLFFRAVRGKPWPLTPIAGAFVLALALAACQSLPTAELGLLSPRGGEKPTAQGLAFAQALALKPLHLVTLVWPSALGLPKRGDYSGFAFAEHFLGLGPVSFVLGLVGLAVRRSKWKLGLVGLGAAFLLVAMGTPLAALIYYHVPALGLTAGFQRVVFVFCLAWALLAGLGIDGLVRGREGEDGRWWVVGAGIAAGIVGQAVVLVLMVLPVSKAALAERPTAVTEWLAAHDDGQGRVLAVTPRAAWRLKPRPWALLPPNTAAVYRLRDVQGYDSLYPRVYKDAAARWEHADPAPVANGNMVLLENVDAPELGRVGVRYVVTGGPVGSARLREVAEFGGAGGRVWVYERVDYQSPYRLVTSYRVLPLRATTGYGRVRVELPPGEPGASWEVFIAETPYPGWRAYLDGRPVAWTIHPGLAVVRQVAVSAGAQPRRLDFIYWPAAAAVGMFVTLVGLVLTAALTVGGRRAVR